MQSNDKKFMRNISFSSSDSFFFFYFPFFAIYGTAWMLINPYLYLNQYNVNKHLHTKSALNITDDWIV